MPTQRAFACLRAGRILDCETSFVALRPPCAGTCIFADVKGPSTQPRTDAGGFCPPLSRLSHGDNRRQYLQYKYRLYREITYNIACVDYCHRLSDCHIASV